VPPRRRRRPGAPLLPAVQPVDAVLAFDCSPELFALLSLALFDLRGAAILRLSAIALLPSLMITSCEDGSRCYAAIIA